MPRTTPSRSVLALALAPFIVTVIGACAPPDEETFESSSENLSTSNRVARYARIRDAAAARGVANAYLLAGIAYTEGGLAHCWSEATWACQGPRSPDCGGGPVIAGAYDGPCSLQEGGLGMFQFDAGTFQQTIGKYGPGIVTIEGQTAAAVDFVTNMVMISAYTTDAETPAKARAWINRFDPNNGVLRDQWVKTVLRHYNGCQPGWECWSSRYPKYNDGLSQVLADTQGTGFWRAGTTCPGGSGVVVGAIEAKYRQLGGCDSLLGRPITNEMTPPDGVGRYSVFERGSIYWTPSTGAHEVHGLIRDKWRDVGWEVGILGYPISDEIRTPDGVGRFNVFQRGSIYWTPSTGAHEVLGRIRDKYKDLGWEAGVLGYPVSGEYAVDGGRKSDFEHGSITWLSATDEFEVETDAVGAGDGGTE